MPREINRWAMNPRKPSSSPLPEVLKMEVTTKANELIETVLKPNHIQPPFGQITDGVIWTQVYVQFYP